MLTTVLHTATTAPVPLDQVFWSEVVGTGLLTLLGCGVVANVVLSKTLGNAGGWLLINVGWGFAVLAGVFAAFKSGAHLNPAVTFGILTSGAAEYAPGVDVSAGSTLTYLAAEMVGAFLGAVVAWLAYKKHFDEHTGADDAASVDATVDLRDDLRDPGHRRGGPDGEFTPDWPTRAESSLRRAAKTCNSFASPTMAAATTAMPTSAESQ